MKLFKTLAIAVVPCCALAYSSCRPQRLMTGTGRLLSPSASPSKFRVWASITFRPAPMSSRFWIHNPTDTSSRSSTKTKPMSHDNPRNSELSFAATDKTVITFRERPAGEPEALRAWFYPGREWGEQFVYAKSRAIELAKETNEPVLATPIELDSGSDRGFEHGAGRGRCSYGRASRASSGC